jgi:hypothetical protein
MQLCPTGLRCLNVHALIGYKDSTVQESTVRNPSIPSPGYQNCDVTLICPSLLNKGSISLLPAAASAIPVLAGYRGGSLGSAASICYAR